MPRRASSRRSAPAGRAKPAPQPPEVPPGHRLFILDVPFAERAVAAASGARWNAALQATVYVGPDLPGGLHPYVSQPFSWERWLEDDFNGSSGSVPSPAGTLKARPHQLEGAVAIANAARIGARGFLLADEVGVGKTITALEGLLALAEQREIRHVLVVCPLAVVAHWRRTIADMGLTRHGIRFCVINYDRVKKLLEPPPSALAAKRLRTRNKRIAKDGTSRVDWDLIILDESHKLRNPDSQRSRSIARIAKYANRREDAPFILWASATAGQTPLETSYMAPLLAQITRSPSGDLKDFGEWLRSQGFNVQHESRFDKWIWTEDPRARHSDIKRLHALLFGRKTPVAIRRLPTDIAGWPEIVRILLPVDLGPEHRRLYQEAWTAFRRELRLAARGKDPKAGMVARLRFRQKASLLRVDGTIQHAMDLLDNGHQVAISCQFLESVDAIRDGLMASKVNVAIMDGRAPSEREEQRLRFQRGEAQVIIYTPVEGFSLHASEILADGTRATSAPRSTVIHDPRFSGIESIQTEGRCHRDGQAANVYYAFAADTVEEDIVRTLLGRIESTKAMVGDDTSTVKELEHILDGSRS